jgi:hypothetical protein
MGDQYSVGVSGIALSSATAKTVLELVASASRRGALKYFAVSFNGVVSDIPVLVEVIRGTATVTGTTITPAQVDPAAAAAQATVKHSASAEGTPATVPLESYYVTPNGGLFAIQFPLGDEYTFTSASHLRIRCTAPSAETVAVACRFEE